MASEPAGAVVADEIRDRVAQQRRPHHGQVHVGGLGEELGDQPADPAEFVKSFGKRLTAVVARDNIVGLQFHPEKSQRAGLQMLGNFLDWRP